MRGTMTLTLAPIYVLFAGCSLFEPRWHSGAGDPHHHVPSQAVVHGGSLSISGHIDRLCAFTDYGVKVYSVTDDRGTALAFRSAQIGWAKGMYFALEMSEPHPEAQIVEFDIAFTSRSGVDRVKGALPIERDGPVNYLIGMDTWDRAETANRCEKK